MLTRKRRSPRLDLREQDNRLGRYPTIARTGDVRLGNRPIFFDDTDTLIYSRFIDTFSTGQMVSLPTTLPTGSKYLVNELTTSILVQGNVIKETDQWMTPRRQFESLGAFKEANLFEQDIKTSEFFGTGSAIKEFGLGLISNLGSKTRISLEIPIVNATQLKPTSASIYYLNAVGGDFQEIGSSIRGRPQPNGNFWEARLFGPFGNNLLSTSINDVYNLGHDDTLFPNIEGYPNEARSYLNDIDTTPYGGPIFNNLGRVLQLAATQSVLINPIFAATSSQMISLQNKLAHPFLLEKVIIEVPFKAGPGWTRDFTRFTSLPGADLPQNVMSPYDAGGPCISIGLINQINPTCRELILSATVIPAGDNFTSASNGGINRFDRYSVGFLSFGKPTYIIPTGSDETFTGSIRMELEAESSNGVVSIGFNYNRRLNPAYPDVSSFRNSFAISVNPFGRSMRGVQSGRSIFGKEYSVPETDPTSKLEAAFGPFGTADGSGRGGSNIDIFSYEKRVASPYLLFPNDNLVLSISKYRACVSQSALDLNPRWRAGDPLDLNQQHDIWINTGSISIVMYGSLIKEGSEHHDTLNSRLDTNSVHEMISEISLDEWDIGSSRELSGSYTAQFMSGTTTAFADLGERKWSRALKYDATDFDYKRYLDHSIYYSEQITQLFEQVKLNRTVQLVCEDEVFYDSLIPRFDEIFTLENTLAPYNAYSAGAGFDMLLTVDAIDGITNGFSVIDWTRSFPFEPKYSTLVRTKRVEKVYSKPNASFFSSNPGVSRPLAETEERIVIESFYPNNTIGGGGSQGWNIVGEFKNGTFTGLRYKDLIKVLYGSGDMNNIRKGNTGGGGSPPGGGYEDSTAFYGSCGRPKYKQFIAGFPGSAPNFGYDGVFRGIEVRGWKYGLINGTSQQTQVIFRRDHYGQFRDMLEQRIDAKFYDGKSVLTSPVKVQFVNSKGATLNPQNTFSSNLSFEASSSLPYFDGNVRNREEPIYGPSIYSVRFTK